jgi:GGDEF domain-containing protein
MRLARNTASNVQAGRIDRGIVGRIGSDQFLNLARSYGDRSYVVIWRRKRYSVGLLLLKLKVRVLHISKTEAEQRFRICCVEFAWVEPQLSTAAAVSERLDKQVEASRSK